MAVTREECGYTYRPPGVACPQLSDEPSYTMVESSGGGSCRCACQEDFNQEESSSGCCSPHVFTSILLGILSCVLMTGGVFLAFHRWDPMWLMVSGVGVVLIVIGTILHCCNNMSRRPKRHPSAGKGCCSRPIPPDHSGHLINNGSLTEQLLPLSNARSVSQLSLNMLPGYFPPVVTAYGIEQHSAVVQNINRLVQQQQQQQLQQQQPQSPGAISQGVASNAGKSFIVLSLPGDASAANIQNLVATVYQLDGNTTESTANETAPNILSNVISVKPNSPVPLLLKNAEVQTCNVWPIPVASTSGASSSAACRSTSTEESPVQATPAQPIVVSTASCGSTQTDDILPISAEIPNLMDCSTNISPNCDNSPSVCDSQTTTNNSASLANIPSTSSSSSSADLLDVTLTTSSASAVECTGASVLVDIPELLPAENTIGGPLLDSTAASNHSVDGVVSPTSDCPEVLVDISDETNSGDVNGNSISGVLLEELVNNNFQQVQAGTTQESSVVVAAQPSTSNDNLMVELPETTNSSNLQNLNPELLLSTSNLSTVDTDIDDGELMERSSPPPSYEDVTLEGDGVAGAFGLAYGTI